jgi:2-hydroxy-6-oxonona-2,4-dienedioate hydrolase
MSASTVIRIDVRDPRTIEALAAERALFAHYGLRFQQEIVAIDRHGLRVRVLDVGEGPAVLVVPGGSGEAWQMAPLLARCSGWRAIVVNRPGGGLSDGIDHRAIDLRGFAVETLTKVMDAFELARAPVIGNSMGGLWAFWLALDRRERVSSLVELGCPALALGTSVPAVMRLLHVPGLRDLILASMQPRDVGSALGGLRRQGSTQQAIDLAPLEIARAACAFFNLPTYRPTWRTLVPAVSTIFGARVRYQLTEDQLRRVIQPVLLIWGRRDPFGGVAIGRRVAGALRQASFHEIDAGHLPFFDQPADCARLIDSFLSAPTCSRPAMEAR